MTRRRTRAGRGTLETPRVIAELPLPWPGHPSILLCCD